MASAQKKSQGQALVALMHQTIELAVQQRFPKSEPSKDASPLLLALWEVHPTLCITYHNLHEATASQGKQSEPATLERSSGDKHG